MTVSTSIDGSVALVTGATRGLGRAIALELAHRGARIVAVGRSTDEVPNRLMPGTLEGVRAELEERGASVLTVPANLADASQVEMVAAKTLEWAGRCDILVNNASYTPAGGFLDVPVSRWATGSAITVFAPVILIQRLLPGMLERGSGRILNIGSEAGGYREVPEGQPRYKVADTPLLYCVTKAALERLTVGLHDQFGHRGVAVNNLRAGQMSTEAWHLMRAVSGFDDPPESVHTAEEVAQAACWMLEQPTSFSGNIIDFDGLIERGVLPAKEYGLL